MIFVTADIVAELTGFDSAAAFLRERDRLERDHDFPTPMPTCRRPMKWRRDAVTAWAQTQCAARSAATAFAGTNVILLDEARRL